MTFILARSFARALKDSRGLHGVALPSGIADEEDALIELTRHANNLWMASRGNKVLPAGDDVPFAVLFLKRKPAVDLEFGVFIHEGELAQFRLDNRLFVGSARELATFTSTIPVTVGDAYPSGHGQNGTLPLRSLADAILSEFCSEVSSPPPLDSLPRCVDALANILHTLAISYEDVGAVTVDWNAAWFDHVNYSLMQLLDAMKRINTGLDFTAFLEEYLYAAFSLPKPRNGFDKPFLKARQSKTAISQALKTFWCNSNEAQMSIAMLKNYPEYVSLPAEIGHPLSLLEWGTYDDTISSEGAKNSALLGWALHDGNANSRIQYFSKLTEDHFFNPRRDDQGVLEIQGQSEGMFVYQIDGSSLYIVNGSHLDLPNSQIVSPSVRVIVPSRAGASPTEDNMNKSEARLVISKGFFDGEIVNGGTVCFDGNIAMEIKAKGANYKYVPKPQLLGLQLDPSDSLVGLVMSSAKASFVLLAPGASGLLLFPIRPDGLAETPQIISQTELVNGEWKELDPQEVEIETNKLYRAVIFGSNKDSVVSFNGTRVLPVSGSQFLWSTDPFTASGLDRLMIDSLEILMTSTSDSDSSPESPIVAAIQKVSHARTAPKNIHHDSLRGDLEDFYPKIIERGRWRSSLGHVVLASDRLGLVGDIAIDDENFHDFELSADMLLVWENAGLGRISSELRDSSEVDSFRKAFETLNLTNHLRRSDADGVESFNWVSKTSWKHLIDEPGPLDEYLSSYEKMVRKANELDDRVGRLWATYPFSVSIWQTSNVPRLQSVLISPLHPIRLAWIAKMEHSLRNARNSEEFCGTIEGWNFPIVGPANTANGKLIAVPCDTDSDQLFLGWSLMVNVSIDGHDIVTCPAFAGSRKLPGISNAGLNAQTVKDALRDFRRLHPHVSTLTIDMAARNKTAKLMEMDQAVIEEFSQWVLQERLGKGLVGGVRVFDSLNREGPRPDFLGRNRASNSSSPITWKRYQDDPMVEIDANIRILQDSGVAVEMTENASATYGTIGTIPFRRFEIPTETLGARNGEVHYRPALSQIANRGHFYEALRAIESPRELLPSIGLQLQGNSPLLGAAQWTISGEAMISPAALASLLSSNQGSSQMLWEWHPPFLDGGGAKGVNSAIEKRSYFTLAKIPKILQGKIKSKMAFLLGRDAVDQDVRKVFNVLGSQGIGLSALIAAGGSQLTGALGFYSVFALNSSSASRQMNRFIMPIDVCNQFLGTLAGNENGGRDKKRADLLVIELMDESICFTPIEIKFYGTENLNGIQAQLPNCGSAALQEASSQAVATLAMLRAAQLSWETSKADRDNPDGHSLKANALATFVEAAMRVHPSAVEVDTAVKSLQRIIDGTINIRLGRPLVAFFIPTDSDDKVIVGLDIPNSSTEGTHAEFICDPRLAIQQVELGGGHVIDEWNRSLDWSLRSQAAESTTENAPNFPSEPNSGSVTLPTPNIDPVDIDASASIEPESLTPSSISGASNPESKEPESLEVVETNDHSPTLGRSIEGDGVKFVVGTLTNSIPEAQAVFWPSNTALNQLNVGVVGDLGTGKTQLVKSLLSQLRSESQRVQPNPMTALILDYKHDYQDESFLNAVDGKVLKPHKIPLDIFRVVGEDNKPNRYKRASGFVDVIKKIYGGVGPVQSENLKRVIMAAYDRSSASPTLAEVAAGYSAAVPNADSVSAVLNIFVMQEIFSSEASELKTMAELMNNSVLVLDLRELDPDQATKNALVALFLNQYFEYMIQLPKWPFEQNGIDQLRRINSYIVVDEATNIMEFKFDVLKMLLLQGREYGVGVLLSSQYLSHFLPSAGVNYGEPLLTWFIHKVPNVTVSELRNIGFPGATIDDASRISSLPVHNAFYKSLNYSGKFMRGRPFFEL